MLRQQMRRVGGESAEVKKPQRHAVDAIVAVAVLHVTVRQIPVRDVASRIAQHEVREIARHQIDPALIDEVAVLDGVEALAPQPLRPPIEKRRALETDADEAEVVRAGDQEIALRRHEAVARQRFHRVRIDQDAVRVRELAEIEERREDLDVGIEIQNRLVEAREQILKRPRLERRRQLDDVVDRGHPMKLRLVAEREIGGQNHVGEIELRRRIAVDQHDRKAQAVMGLRQRFREHARKGEITLSADGENAHDREADYLTAGARPRPTSRGSGGGSPRRCDRTRRRRRGGGKRLSASDARTRRARR